MRDFTSTQGLGWSLGDCSCWKRRRFLLVLLSVNQNWGFSPWNHLKIVKKWRAKGCIYDWSKDSVCIYLTTLPVEFNVFQFRFLFPVCAQILWAYSWEHFVPHFDSPLLVWANGNSRWRVVQKISSLRQQEAPSCQKKFIGRYCHFLHEVVYSQSNWIWYKVERPLNTVVGGWENFVALLRKCLKWKGNQMFGQLPQPMGSRHVYAINSRTFHFFCLTFGCAWLWLVNKTLQKRRLFSFCSYDSLFLQSNVYHHHQTT